MLGFGVAAAALAAPVAMTAAPKATVKNFAILSIDICNS
jgi:hypothetical protein